MRRDLTHPQQTVQACHAVIEMTKAFSVGDVHPSVIILEVQDELTLSQIVDKIKPIESVEFREPDIGNQLTAIATRPVYGEERKIFRKFKLLK